MAAIVAPNIVTDGLMACWDAANRVSYPGTGTTWYEAISHSPSTRFASEINFSTANAGVMVFDGTDDGVVTSINSPTGDFAIECWIYQETQLYDHQFVANYVIGAFSLGCLESTAKLKLDLKEDDGGSAGDQTNVFDNVDISSYISVDTWHHYVATRTGSAVTGYIDGVVVTTATYAPTLFPGVLSLGIQQSASSPGVGYNHGLEGKMGPVRIYNKGLTAAEVLQNYEALKPRFTPRITKSGLTANFDAGDPQSYNGGTTWKDTANHNSVTLENSSTGFDFNPANGGFFEFDGTDDYCSGGPVPPSGDSTYGAWCYFSDDNWEPIFNSSDSTLYLWFGRRGGGEWLGELFLHYHNTNNNTSHYTVTSNTLSLNTWYYITATWNGSAITLYINGASQSATTTGTPTNITNASGIWFGQYSQ